MAWTNQIASLVKAGYRVIVPDQRGYNTSDKPVRIEDYSIDLLVEDVRCLIKHFSNAPVDLAGHDWGGAVTWKFASMYPEMLNRLVIVNSPHRKVMQDHLKSNPNQRRKSWYMYLFQLPWLPEFILARNNNQRLVQALQSTSRRGAFPEDLIQKYREAWQQKGALTSMLNWYRAAMRSKNVAIDVSKIKVPTLLIWGGKDHALGSEMARPSIEFCESGRLEVIAEAGHWILHEQPERISTLMLEFLTGEHNLLLTTLRAG